MSTRVSRKALEYRIEWLNKALGRSTVAWTQANGKNVASVGTFVLDHCLGGWQIEEISNEGGGVSCPFGHTRMSSGDLCTMLEAILAAVQMGKSHVAKQVKPILPDLKHYAGTHGPGPDRRLAELEAALA